MTFSEFRQACKYQQVAAGDVGNTFVRVCDKPGRRPPGHSWCTCDEEHCPFFGAVYGHVAMYANGEKFAEMDEMRVVFPPAPPNWRKLGEVEGDL